jgi:SAM-dependent methyltransferase
MRSEFSKVHDAVLEYVGPVVAAHGLDGGDVLDLGGRDVNGTPRHFFPNATRYIVVDYADHPSVDIVADASTLDLDQLFDVVISTELLEHTPLGAAIVASACRHLKPGGAFVATMAGPGRLPHGMSGAHLPAPDEWYENVDTATLDGWLAAAGFDTWTIDQKDTDVRCVAFKGAE